MDTLLLCGGPLEEDFALTVLEDLKPDCIIGIDRGLNFCYRQNIHPDYILGDFDSIDREVLDYYEHQSEIPVKRYKPEKRRHRYQNRPGACHKAGQQPGIPAGRHRGETGPLYGKSAVADCGKNPGRGGVDSGQPQRLNSFG
mgnify:CR=1 FL=1